MSELATESPPVHDLLLALAGRLDDDLLAWARELLAVGERDQAVELATAALAAERVVLPASLRSAVVAAARVAQTDLDVDRALAPAGVADGTPHRFDPAAAPGDPVVAALQALPARRLAGCTLHLTWRRTPAGTAPGPLPRPVVLVEADPDRSPDVLAYLLATELDRAGVPASVEVLSPGGPRPAYHVAAMQESREVVRGAAVDDVAVRHETAEGPGREEAPDGPEPTLRRPAPGRRRRPEAVEEPADVVVSLPGTDPLSGPLREPLLAPLLDPTGAGEEAPPPVPAVASAPEPAGTTDVPEVPEPRDVPDEWDDDWRSGEWAMPRPVHSDPTPSPSEQFDAFADPAPEPPDRVERTGRIAPENRSGPVPLVRPVELPPAAAGEVSLFESPTARVGSTAGRAEAAGRPDGGPSSSEQVRGGHPAGRVADPTGSAPSRPVPPPPVRGPSPAVSPLRAGPPREDPPVGPGPQEVPLFGEVPGPGPRPVAPEEPRPGRRRRPDEVEVADGAGPDAHAALLHGVERDLLAQFQAELGERERRPRPYRRAGQNGRSGPIGSGRNGSQQNGSHQDGSHQDGSAHNGSAHNGRTVNGHGSDDDRPPPDLAG